jgi:hypothetical protein
MSATQALAFVRKHGVVLLSARGPVPSLVEAIAGESIRGSWWAHPKSHQIYGVLERIGGSKQILTCRLVGGKITLVHRRVWPALVRLSRRLPKDALASVRQEHTARGSHRIVRTPFPRWVPDEIVRRARRSSGKAAIASLGVELARALSIE